MLNRLKKLDWTILAILVLFMVLSTAVIYSATVDNAQFRGANMPSKNVINYLLGFLVLLGIMMFDYRILLKSAYYFYAFGIVLLIAVYTFGEITSGAKSWFTLPLGFNFQPAELMKVLLILALAKFISRNMGAQMELKRDVIPIGVLVFIPFALVMIQPDLGNAIIYLAIMLGMLWIGNIKYTYVLIGTAAIIAFLALFLMLYNHFYDEIEVYLKERGSHHWMQRIDTYLDPENASSNAIYQLDKSMTAIGSGGLLGDGYLKGNSVHNNFVPLAFSDSVFVVIGEEFGFVGSSILLLLYFVLIYRMILISIDCRSLNGTLIIIGIVSMFVFQIFENIGMLLGIMPLTGITLPFVSYGGTSVLINMMCIGIVMSIKLYQEKPSEY